MFVLRFTFSTLRSFGDGDFVGVANGLPPNANPDAYYWLDLSVTGVLGVATIRVTCDGSSDLGDHVIIARTNEVCHIPLLAGATYAAAIPISAATTTSQGQKPHDAFECHKQDRCPYDVIVKQGGNCHLQIAHRKIAHGMRRHNR